MCCCRMEPLSFAISIGMYFTVNTALFNDASHVFNIGFCAFFQAPDQESFMGNSHVSLFNLQTFALGWQRHSQNDDCFILPQGMGTVPFMAPKLLSSKFDPEALTSAPDIWALGCTLYSMSELKEPFEEHGNPTIFWVRLHFPFVCCWLYMNLKLARSTRWPIFFVMGSA